MKQTNPMRAWARIGASVRLQELEAEAARIRNAFPDLRGASRRARLAAPTGGMTVMPAPRKRRKMSAAGRAAIIAGAKKRWAKWRKKKA